MHDVYVGVSAFDIVSIALLIGCLGSRLWLLPPAAQLLHKPLWRLLGFSLVAVTVSSAALLVDRTMEMSGAPLGKAMTLLGAVLKQTQFGHVWLIRPAALILLWAIWIFGRRSARQPTSTLVMMLLVCLLAFTRSATGHPADAGPFTVPEWVDWIHLITASLWAGSVFAVAAAILPRLFSEHLQAYTIVNIIQRLSRLSGWALAAVLITGVIAARHYLVGWHNLWASPYGHTLLIKLAFVAAAISLGAINRYIHLPRLRLWARDPFASASRPLIPFARSLRLEAILLVAAFIMAAFLLHSMPPSAAPKIPYATTPAPAQGHAQPAPVTIAV